MKEITLGLSFGDVLLIPQLSPLHSRSEVDLTTKIAPDIELKIPLISINMDTVTGVDMAIAMDTLGGIGFIPRFEKPEIQANKIAKITAAGTRCIAAMGIRDDYLKRAEMVLKAGAIAMTLDIAHAHSARCLEAVTNFKNKFPNVSLLAGTVATYQGAKDLIKAGADSIRVGIGVGTVCTTRIETGSGVPQITALLEATRAAQEFKNKFIISDGGAANSGDIIKALACGASAVISGSLYAGTDEASGKLIEQDGLFYKEYNGSTSPAEKARQMEKDGEGKKPTYKLHVEGVEGMVKYKGPVKDVIESLCAGIRSGFSYSGAKNIQELWEKVQFIQITAAGMAESKPHDLIVRS